LKTLQTKTTIQTKLATLGLCSLLLVAMLPMTACPQQTVLAALTTTLGNAAASIASFEGNAALAAQLQTDTAAATAAIQNWKSGTPAQNVVQALQIVVDDLNLLSQIPGAAQYAPLISLALSTAISIIEIVDPGAVPTAMAKVKLGGVSTAGAPKSAKEFRARWNGICSTNPHLAKVELK
jgi:hypothetical protein